MSRIILAMLAILAGCERTPCQDRAVLIGTDSLEDDRIICDKGAAVWVEETDRGLMLMCSCPRVAGI